MKRTKSGKNKRSFTLLEVLTVVSMIGVLLLVEGSLFAHFFKSLSRRGKTYDQLRLVSVVSDKIRSDLKGQPDGQVVTVDPDRLVITSKKATVEYHVNGWELERYENVANIRRLTGVWKIPDTKLAFSRQPSRDDAVLVELNWSLGRPNRGQNTERSLAFQMDFAAKGSLINVKAAEKQP